MRVPGFSAHEGSQGYDIYGGKLVAKYDCEG